MDYERQFANSTGPARLISRYIAAALLLVGATAVLIAHSTRGERSGGVAAGTAVLQGGVPAAPIPVSSASTVTDVSAALLSAERMAKAQEAPPAADRVTLLRLSAPEIGPRFEYWVTSWTTSGILCVADALGETYCEDELADAAKTAAVVSVGGRVPHIVVRAPSSGKVSMRFDDGTTINGVLLPVPGCSSALAALSYESGRAGSVAHVSVAGTTIAVALPTSQTAIVGVRSGPVEAIPQSPAAPASAP